uniref:Saposin B-type domain-containing protein n=1 Tax=Globodera pallida TaxID=36090 RepID=A0A183CBG9_GLOPA
MFFPILLFNVLLILSEGAPPWQQKMTNKCRDGREGVQMEEAKRDISQYNGSDVIEIAIYIGLVAFTCPDEIVPIVEYCKAKSDGKSKLKTLFCVWNGLLIIIDADADKCAERAKLGKCLQRARFQVITDQ